jgi:uncharacterized OB-fold protein
MMQQSVVHAADLDTDRPSDFREHLLAAFRDGRLDLQQCAECATVQYPPREVCRKCLSPSLQWREQPRGGKLVAVTAIRRPYEPKFQNLLPVRIGLVALDAGPVIVAFIDDDCYHGSNVHLGVELDGTGAPIFKARSVA